MAVEKAIASSSLVEVIDRTLDKGVVIDAWVRVLLVGIELLAITAARSGLEPVDAAKIVDVVRDYRDSGEYDQTPTLRACIMIARVAAMLGLEPSAHHDRFVQVCLDVLESKIVLTSNAQERRTEQHCDGRAPANVA